MSERVCVFLAYWFVFGHFISVTAFGAKAEIVFDKPKSSGEGIYFIIASSLQNCNDTASVTVTKSKSPIIEGVLDQVVCESYILPTIDGEYLSGNEGYFTSPKGVGRLEVGTRISSSMELYVYDESSLNSDCYVEELLSIEIKPRFSPYVEIALIDEVDTKCEGEDFIFEVISLFA